MLKSTLFLLLLAVTSLSHAQQAMFAYYLTADNSSDSVAASGTVIDNNADLKIDVAQGVIDSAVHEDCSNLGYKITLFSPCGDQNGTRLWRQTRIMVVAGIGVAASIAILPEEIAIWEKGAFVQQWYDNVKAGPIWDNDAWYINYIGHPYFGGVYYQAARKSGYNQWNSFTYTALMSTFYWEYGLEAFAEIPSIQDLFVTPIGGWVYGEWAYNQEKEIRKNGNLVMGSEFMGSVTLFLIDPVGVIDDWCCVSKKVEVTAFNISRWPAQQNPLAVNPGKDYWGIKFAMKVAGVNEYDLSFIIVTIPIVGISQ